MTGTYAEWMIFGLIILIVLLIITSMTMEYRAEREKERADESFKRLSDLLDALDHTYIETGVCCCGDNMKTHDPGYNCGHSPLDMWDYHGEPVLQAARNFVLQHKSDD